MKRWDFLRFLSVALFGTMCLCHVSYAETCKTTSTTGQCLNFHVTTTNLSKGSTFTFTLSAQGTFYVFCGSGGRLSSTAGDVDASNGYTITRTNTTEATYTCTYSSAGTKNIWFGGHATGYNPTRTIPSIKFTSPDSVAAIDGSLGLIFSTISEDEQPSFYYTFHKCSGITSVPDDLFSGVNGAAPYMFKSTFSGCSGLTTVPENLFNGISGSADYLFNFTFDTCTGIKTVPGTLFSGVNGAAPYMFEGVFHNCQSLEEIPENLFSGVNGADTYMFRKSFYQNYALTSIPENLFSGVSGSAVGIFEGTFRSCNHITSIPENLFSGITGSAQSEFQQTFSGCSNMGGYIPASTFSGLISNGSPATVTNMWTQTFANTNLVTTCPDGTNTITTGYESSWGNKAVCENLNVSCDAGYYLPGGADACEICPMGSYCAGGDYIQGDTDQGRNDCPDGSNLPSQVGLSTENQCNLVCDGAYYYDSGECMPCPNRYDYNTAPGKTSIQQCQVSCPAGTYVDQPDVSNVNGGYTRLEYLESQGRQYIDTGHKHESSNIRGIIRVGTNVNISNNVNIMGNQEGTTSTDGGYSVGWAPPANGKPGNLFKVWVQSSNSRLNGATPHYLNAGSIHDIEFKLTNNKRWITYDGQTFTNSHNGKIVSNKNIHLFDNGVHQMDQNFKGLIYYIKIYEDNVLKHNYLPVRENSGQQRVGILDTITGEFYTNSSGTGAFSVGTDVTEPCVPMGAGYWAAASVVNQGDVGERTACAPGTYSTDPNATSITTCTPCPISQFSDVEGSTQCRNCPTGYTYDDSLGKSSQNQCKIHCNDGTYLASSGASTCTNVGAGYYAAQSTKNYGQTGTRTACSAGLTTIGYGTGANEAGDCGRILHIGNNSLYLRSTKKTTPSLNIDMDGDGTPDLFANMTTTNTSITANSNKKMKINYNNQTWFVHDDSAN